MSLPPDPHDDDLTQPERGPSGSVPPPPPPPPPPSPDIAPLASAAAALGRDLGRPVSGPPTVAGPATAAAPPAPPAGPPTLVSDPDPAGELSSGPPAAVGARPPTPPPVDSPRRGRGKLLAAVGAVVLVVAVVGGIALAGGGDDDETTGPAAGSDATEADAPVDDTGTDPAAEAPASSDTGTTPPAADDPATADDPASVAGAMFTAAIEGDCAGVVGHMTPEAYGPNGETEQQAIAACAADADASELREASLVDATLVSESGDAAVVAVTLALGDEQRTRDVPMERIDGEWKVAIVAG